MIVCYINLQITSQVVRSSSLAAMCTEYNCMLKSSSHTNVLGPLRGHVRMVVGFTATCAISAYHHLSCEFEPHSRRGVLYTTLCGFKFFSDLRQVDGFLWVRSVSSTNKTDRHDIAEIVLKVTLNTINQTTNVLVVDLFMKCWLIISNAETSF